jgi:hypothetical protein
VRHERLVDRVNAVQVGDEFVFEGDRLLPLYLAVDCMSERFTRVNDGRR